eukprot:CAMPEP_0170366688 /NCGR_PEP_ID=MMETSP0117_2-20130122/6546_1 /TAXON_ID=400756 /ORGANISM="Durinskia baltica, Strain CSIRO CS-38" /LENGTH=98 /DNA_ID=CAMNT_0010621283 /DNA_START=119 /DNA_END=412 /DNA_ORIENTATION=-
MKPSLATTKPSPSGGGALLNSNSIDDKPQSTPRPVANAWTQSNKLLNKIKGSLPSTAPVVISTAVSNLPFIKPQPCAQKNLSNYIHRIGTPVIYGAIN